MMTPESMRNAAWWCARAGRGGWLRQPCPHRQATPGNAGLCLYAALSVLGGAVRTSLALKCYKFTQYDYVIPKEDYSFQKKIKGFIL